MVNGKKKSKKRLWITVAAIWVVALAAYFYIPVGYLCASPEVHGDPRESLRAAAPEWTPDSSRIVFGHEGSVYVINQDGSELNRIHGSDRVDDLAHFPFLSGDDSRITYNEYQGGDRWTWMSSRLDGSDVRKTAQIFDDKAFNAPWRKRPGISPDRSRIAFVEDAALYISEYQGSSSDVWMEEIWENRSGWMKLAEGDWIGSPRWSPDGRRIAFVKFDIVPGDDNVVLYLAHTVSPNGSNLETVHQIVTSCFVGHGCPPHNVAWSPDGTKLLISGSSSISVVNADGTGS